MKQTVGFAFVLFLLLIIMLFCYILQNKRSFADISPYSPSFVRHEIKDELSVWSITTTTNYSEFTGHKQIRDDALENITGDTLGDIESVYYISDGKMLNVTFRLTDPFKEAPVKHVPSYNFFIDGDSDPSTGGDFGFDYRIGVSWDNNTKSWYKIVEEISASGNTQVLSETKNYTNFFNKNDSMPILDVNSYFRSPCCYVTIPVDLHLINYPKQYTLFFSIIDSFYIIDKNNKRNIIYATDSTPDVQIPPPRLSMSAEQKLVEVRAGDEKTIGLSLNSTSSLPTHVFLSANKIKEMSFKLIPDNIYITPNGFSNSLLKIKTFPDTALGPNTVTINAQAYFPTISKLNRYSFERERPGLSTYSNVAIAITNPLTFDEKFLGFWNVYGNAINLLAGGFLGGFSGFLFARMEKKKKGNN